MEDCLIKPVSCCLQLADLGMFSVDTEFLFIITDTSSQDTDLSQAFSLARQGQQRRQLIMRRASYSLSSPGRATTLPSSTTLAWRGLSPGSASRACGAWQQTSGPHSPGAGTTLSGGRCRCLRRWQTISSLKAVMLKVILLSVLSGGVAAGAAQPGHQARQGGGQHQVAPRDHGQVRPSYDVSGVVLAQNRAGHKPSRSFTIM